MGTYPNGEFSLEDANGPQGASSTRQDGSDGEPGRAAAGERPLTAADCYRFVLSHPDVNVCITAPSTAELMEENLEALDAGPLDEEEIARVRRIGKHIYGN